MMVVKKQEKANVFCSLTYLGWLLDTAPMLEGNDCSLKFFIGQRYSVATRFHMRAKDEDMSSVHRCRCWVGAHL